MNGHPEMSHKLLEFVAESSGKIDPSKAVCWLSTEQTKESNSPCSSDLKMQQGQKKDSLESPLEWKYIEDGFTLI